MTQTINVLAAGEPDEEKVIEIKETQSVTAVKHTTLSKLRAEYADCLENIEKFKKDANAIVDMINSIDKNTDITVSDIPAKLELAK